METVLEKRIDKQGRIVLPKHWRKKYGVRVNIIECEDKLYITPAKDKPLSQLPELEVELKTELTDWQAVKKEILQKK